MIKTMHLDIDSAPVSQPDRMTLIRPIAKQIHQALTGGVRVPYAVKRGVVWVDETKRIVRRANPRSYGWERAKIIPTDGSERMDRALNSFMVANHIAGRCTLAMVLPEESEWACIDLDAHIKDSDGNTPWEYLSRLKLVTLYVCKWVQLQDVEPLVLTSPGGGYHVWFRMDQRWPAEQLRAAIKQDVEDFLAVCGVTPLGRGDAPKESRLMGMDWYPGGHAIRVPGGPGQVVCDAQTLRPLDRCTRGKYNKNKRLQRDVVENTREIARAVTGAFAIQSAPTGHTRRNRWEDINPSDVFDGASPEFAALTELMSGRPIRVGAAKRSSVLPLQRVPVCTLPADGPAELGQGIVRGESFRLLLERAEEHGIVISGGSTGVFSAAAKLAWRARSRGIDEIGLRAYVDGIIAISDISPEDQLVLQTQALKRFLVNSNVQPMQGREREGIDLELSEQATQICTLLEVVLNETTDWSQAVIEPAAHVMALAMAGDGAVNPRVVDELCSDTRIPGTRKRVSSAVKRALKDVAWISLTTRYKPGIRVSGFTVQAAAWSALVKARAAAGWFVDLGAVLEDVPAEYADEVRSELAEWLRTQRVIERGRGFMAAVDRTLPGQLLRQRVINEVAARGDPDG